MDLVKETTEVEDAKENREKASQQRRHPMEGVLETYDRGVGGDEKREGVDER